MREDADTPDDSILRADTLSRVRTPAAKRAQISAEFDRSGLSGARFARLHGINYQTLMNWKRKRSVASGPQAGTSDPATVPIGQLKLAAAGGGVGSEQGNAAAETADGTETGTARVVADATPAPAAAPKIGADPVVGQNEGDLVLAS